MYSPERGPGACDPPPPSLPLNHQEQQPGHHLPPTRFNVESPLIMITALVCRDLPQGPDAASAGRVTQWNRRPSYRWPIKVAAGVCSVSVSCPRLSHRTLLCLSCRGGGGGRHSLFAYLFSTVVFNKLDFIPTRFWRGLVLSVLLLFFAPVLPPPPPPPRGGLVDERTDCCGSGGNAGASSRAGEIGRDGLFYADVIS